jgi:predicted enzyme related to lactoylglutathione lyase
VIRLIQGIESILLSSESAKKLAKFYTEKVGLKQTMEAEMGEAGEELFGFEMGKGSALYIVDHSDIKGKNKDSKRIMLSLEVDNIEDDVKKLEKSKVKKIKDIYHVEGYGKIATFEDIDGNYFQLVQVKG